MMNQKANSVDVQADQDLHTDENEYEDDDYSEEQSVTKDLPAVDKLTANQYVVVAYQDTWYPGCIVTVSENDVVVNFMAPTRKPGYYIWPLRTDKQTVKKEFILAQGFIPECVNSGRMWFLPDHKSIQALYEKYNKVFFLRNCGATLQTVNDNMRIQAEISKP